MWERKKLLIWGKTYPEFSTKYYETVCTGAVDGETGKLMRIYPITLRHMNDPIKTYDWIEAEIERNTADSRPESFRIRQNTIKQIRHIGTTKDEWAERARSILSPSNVFRSVEALVEAQGRDQTSLGLIRPKKITKFYKRRKSDDERREWEEQRERAFSQKDLFVDVNEAKKDLVFCPVQYRAKFICEDPGCATEHDCSILDWGLYMLDFKQWSQRGGVVAEEKVIEHIERLMDPEKRDPYLFLGNTKAHPQRFMIVGLFHPPKQLARANRDKNSTLLLPGIDLD